MAFVAKWHLSTYYRLDVYPHDFAEMYYHQNGKCAVCGNPPSKSGFVVDHDHGDHEQYAMRGNMVRGLICFRCNHLVGRYEKGSPITKDAELIPKIEYYLRNHYGACCSTIMAVKEGISQPKVANARILTKEEEDCLYDRNSACRILPAQFFERRIPS